MYSTLSNEIVKTKDSDEVEVWICNGSDLHGYIIFPQAGTQYFRYFMYIKSRLQGQSREDFSGECSKVLVSGREEMRHEMCHESDLANKGTK